MRRLTLYTLLCTLAGLVMFACAKAPTTQQSLVYSGLSEDLPQIDRNVLSGRRILIDPGHGGYFLGTRGQEGLEEAKVNLGVSLYLWGLLNEAGADVHLTRSSERDFLSDADSSLVRDLAWRVAMVDSLQPEIFVSIHHNAQPLRDPDVNAIETYYRFGDPASRDLAFAVHRHLMRNLGIDDGEVRPGNYYVLRNVDVPAILGESSYLTHPPVEENLKLSEKQRLEAEAYFLGVLEYFSRGTPHIEQIAPLDSVFVDVPAFRFALDDVGGSGIDPAAIDMHVNGERVATSVSDDGHYITYPMPWDAANGDYEIALQIRNVLGNSSRVIRTQFTLDLPPAFIAFDVEPATLPPTGQAVRIRARILDRRGTAVADSTVVTIDAEGATAPDSAYVTDGTIVFALAAEATRSAKVTLTAGSVSADKTLAPGDDRGFRNVTIVGGVGVLNDVTVSSQEAVIATDSPTGDYFLPGTLSDGETLWVRAPGYRPLDVSAFYDSVAAGDTIRLEPWYAPLVGLRFVLDPEGGVGANVGAGELGLPGPYVNLRVAMYLREFLKLAGGAVLLTRDSEETLSPRDVVAVTNRFGANRYVEIRHRVAPGDSVLMVNAYHFPGSRNGTRMAGDVQTALADYFGLARRAPTDLVTFPLQQTACPAIVVEYPSIGVLGEELRLGEPWYQRKQAYGLFLGILDHYGVADSASVEVTMPDSTRNWLVTLGNTWGLLTGDDGVVSFERLAAGSYALSARRGNILRDLGMVEVNAGQHRYVAVPAQGSSAAP